MVRLLESVDLTPANDSEASSRRVVLKMPKILPVSVIEVEIFDALISNLEDLLANDNRPKE